MTKMRAVINTKYGPPETLQLKEVEKPVPRADEVLIKVYAVSLNSYDWRVLTATPFLIRLQFGFIKPGINILGADVAGRVEAVGGNVTRFQPGDEVFGEISSYRSGGLAQYVCAGANAFALKPANVTFEEAAAVPLAALTALQGLRDKGGIRAGQKVLINGASGGVGTFAVQIAKAFDAEVTGVCSSGKMDMVRSLGADHVIDYTKENFTKSGKQYDLIFAANGYHPLSDYKRCLSPRGTYVMAGGTNAQIFQAMILGPGMSKAGGKTLGGFEQKVNQTDLTFLKELLEAGKIKPVIDKCYPLSEAAQAFRYLGEGHALGKIVITVERDNQT